MVIYALTPPLLRIIMLGSGGEGGPSAVFIIAAIVASPVVLGAVLGIGDGLREGSDRPEARRTLLRSLATLVAAIGVLVFVYLLSD